MGGPGTIWLVDDAAQQLATMSEAINMVREGLKASDVHHVVVRGAVLCS